MFIARRVIFRFLPNNKATRHLFKIINISTLKMFHCFNIVLGHLTKRHTMQSTI